MPAGDVFLSKAFHTFTQGYVGSPFALCVLPRETEASCAWQGDPRGAQPATRTDIVCALARRGLSSSYDATEEPLECEQRGGGPPLVLPLARRFGVRHVLLLTNVRTRASSRFSPSLASPHPHMHPPLRPLQVRYEGLREMLSLLEVGGLSARWSSLTLILASRFCNCADRSGMGARHLCC